MHDFKFEKHWPSFSHPDGSDYSLAHLDSHQIIYRFDKENPNNHNRTYRVTVSYGLHCFAKDYEWQTLEDKESLMYHGVNESRPFCEKRYRHSLKLPYIVKALGDAKCKDVVFSYYKNDGHAAFHATDEKGVEVSYKIGINLHKIGKGKLHMQIVSAYPLKGREKVKKKSFEVVLKNTRLGKI